MNHCQNGEISRIIPTPRNHPSIILKTRFGVERLRGGQWARTLPIQDRSFVDDGALLEFFAGVDGEVVGADVGVRAVAGEVFDLVVRYGAFFDRGRGEGEC